MKIFFCLCSLLYSLLSLAQNKPFIVDLENSNEDVSLNILFDKIAVTILFNIWEISNAITNA